MKRLASAIPNKEEAAALIDDRSVYVKPFPMKTSIDDVKRFFEDAMAANKNGNENNDADGKVISVRLRRHEESKDFNGTVFVEFATADDAKVRGT